MELRFVTTQILRRFDVAFAKDYDRTSFTAKLQDGFTLATPKLELVFSPRNVTGDA